MQVCIWIRNTKIPYAKSVEHLYLHDVTLMCSIATNLIKHLDYWYKYIYIAKINYNYNYKYCGINLLVLMVGLVNSVSLVPLFS